MPFNSGEHMAERTIPAIERGLATAGRTPGRPRDHRRGDRRRRSQRRGARGGAGRAQPARILRLDARLQAGARRARLGRPPARAQPPLEAGRLGRRWARSSPTRWSTPSPCTARPTSAPRRSCAGTATWADRVCAYFPYYQASDDLIADFTAALKPLARGHSGPSTQRRAGKRDRVTRRVRGARARLVRDEHAEEGRPRRLLERPHRERIRPEEYHAEEQHAATSRARGSARCSTPGWPAGRGPRNTAATARRRGRTTSSTTSRPATASPPRCSPSGSRCCPRCCSRTAPTTSAPGTCRRVLRGEEIWCQLLSEPGAGPTSAACARSPRRSTAGGRSRGQKVWTSGAGVADYALLIARSDPGVVASGRALVLRPRHVRSRCHGAAAAADVGRLPLQRGVPRRRLRPRRRAHRRPRRRVERPAHDAGERAGGDRRRHEWPLGDVQLVALAQRLGRAGDPGRAPGWSPPPSSASACSTSSGRGSRYRGPCPPAARSRSCSTPTTRGSAPTPRPSSSVPRPRSPTTPSPNPGSSGSSSRPGSASVVAPTRSSATPSASGVSGCPASRGLVVDRGPVHEHVAVRHATTRITFGPTPSSQA